MWTVIISTHKNSNGAVYEITFFEKNYHLLVYTPNIQSQRISNYQQTMNRPLKNVPWPSYEKKNYYCVKHVASFSLSSTSLSTVKSFKEPKKNLEIHDNPYEALGPNKRDNNTIILLANVSIYKILSK